MTAPRATSSVRPSATRAAPTAAASRALRRAALSAVLLAAAGVATAQDGEPTAAPVAADTAVTRAEAEHWLVERYVVPEGEVLEVGGLDWMPDGRLAVSTRRGQVWMVEDALADDVRDARFSLFAEGLHEGLGLNVLEVPDGAGGTRHALYVLQRGELTELRDEDGDGRAETWLRVADDWGLSGNYHEFAFGLPADDDGHLYLSLNLGFLSPEWWLGRSVARWRGWVLRVDPLTGETEPWAHGFRSPCGLGFDRHGRLLVTDNQGDWMASTPVYAVERGAFHGHPASLDWTPDYLDNGLHASVEQPSEVPRTPPAVWVPYEWSRSAGNLVPIPESFGPFTDQLVMAELTNGHLLRIQLEEVGGVVQGAAIPLRQRVGSVVRVAFADDGTLVGGLTNRGWGGLDPADGLLRVRATGAPPTEIDRVHLREGGFDVTFTEPLAPGLRLGPDVADVLQYDYDYWWEYGSPERHQTDVPVAGASLSEGRRTLRLEVPDLRAAMCARVTLHDLVGESGRPLLHDTFAYTVNQLADGSHTEELVAKTVPPPPPRQSGKEGWLRLSYGDALDAWESTGWSLVDADLDPDDRSTFRVTPGVNALVNVGHGPASDYTSRWDLGSGTYHVEFMLPEGGRSVVRVQGRYAIELADDTDGLPEGAEPTGTIAPSADGASPARPPRADAYTGAGHWHVLEVDFEAPRFDADGARTDPARFREVRLDGAVIYEDVVFDGPSAGGPADEVARAPLVIGGTTGPVALRTLELRPEREAQPSTEGWLSLIGGDDLSGWRFVPPEAAGAEAFADEAAAARAEAAGWEDPGWLLEDGELVGEGPASWLLSPKGDYTDVSVRASVRINDGGDAGLLLRAGAEGDRVVGYEAQVNTSFADPSRTGGLHGVAPVKVQLIPAGTWFDLEVDVTDEPDGTRVRIAVNGVVTTDHLDTSRRFASGHVALQQHHEGGYVRIRDLRVERR